MRLNPFRFSSRKPSNRLTKFRPQCEMLEDRWVPTTLPAGFMEQNVATGLTGPTSVAMYPDGSGRLLITQQNGVVRVYDPFSGILPTPFLSVSTTTFFERGLQRLEFDPDWANNGFVYVYYTVPTTPVHNRVTRWTTNMTTGNVAVPGSEFRIIRFDNVQAGNHNGGGIGFGNDGMLYLSVGENAVPSRAQMLSTDHGKVLRINPTGDQFPGDPDDNYTIPADNPFVGVAGAREEIFARGFRNPFAMAVHPWYGSIFVNDVGGSGASRREEIDLVDYNDGFGRGGNYAWPMAEGITGNPAWVDPLFAYAPGFGGTNCSIVGGDFYAYYVEGGGFPLPEYQDNYFFPDLCGRWIYRYDLNDGSVDAFATGTAANPVDLVVDQWLGVMYYLTRGSGTSTGQLTIVWYAGTQPGPGGGDVVNGILPEEAGSTTITRQQTLAELSAITLIDSVFVMPPPVQESVIATSATHQPEATDADLWSLAL